MILIVESEFRYGTVCIAIAANYHCLITVVCGLSGNIGLLCNNREREILMTNVDEGLTIA